MDNLDPNNMDNQDPNSGAGGSGNAGSAAATTDAGSVASNWKSVLSTDIKNSPIVQKFEDDVSGLENMIKSHHELEKVFSSHEKVVIPKGPEDVDGWNSFSKALGIPDKAESYGLPDASLPEAMKGLTLDKNKFAEVVHAHKLTPSQAKGLWQAYQDINVQQYNELVNNQKAQITETVNRLKGEWGDTYDVNVELGQAVINKFSDDQEMNDYITSVLSKDPRGIKFLAKIGNQFAENKVGEFSMKTFSQAPDEMQAEIDKMVLDLNGPYMNQGGKFTPAEHQAAVDRVNNLRVLINKARG